MADVIQTESNPLSFHLKKQSFKHADR